MKKYFGLRGNSLHRAIATIAGIGFILFAYDQGVMSGLLTLPEFVNTFPEMDTVNPNLSAHQITFHSKVQGVVIAIYEIVCMFGALGTLWAGDKFGRRRTVFGGAIIMCIGATIQCSAFALSQFIIGRWASELEIPSRISMPLCWNLNFIHLGATRITPLVDQENRVEEAKVVFAALDGIQLDDPFIKVQIREVTGSLSKEAGSRAALKTMCTNGTKKHFHRSMLAIWSHAIQQLSGTNLITYYATSIYEVSIGLSPVNARIVGACQNTAYVFVACIAIFTIERFGRRKLLILGSLGQASSMTILAGTVYLANHGNSHAGIAAALFIFVFNALFGLGWLGIPWLYPAEISSLEIRAPVNGLSTATDWVLNFMVVMITPVAFNRIGVYTYVIFAVMNLLMSFVVLGLYPETSHRSLEEIDHIFENSNPWTPWDVVKIARELPIQE